MVPKMWSGVPPEDLLTPEPALPTQFRDVWHRSRAISSERALVLSVMWQALIDLRKHRFAKRRQHQRLYLEAYQWVASNDRCWPFSFVNLCEFLNLSPESTRQELLEDAAPPYGEIPAAIQPEVVEEAA